MEKNQLNDLEESLKELTQDINISLHIEGFDELS